MASNDSSTPTSDLNVLLITCHDLGQHVGCYGVETVATPNIDGIADRGIRFENACSTTPVCSPARGSLLTGRYPQSNGLMGLTHAPHWWRLGDGEQMLPELLGDIGYETHLAGMQHVVSDESRLGFDHRYARHGTAEDTVAAASEIFDSEGDGPWYAQFGFSEVHRSFDYGTYTEDGVYVPPYLADTEEVRDDLAAFQAAINALDRRVGELLDALEAAGQRDETIIIFATDHGIPYPGAKWWCRSAGVEIALIVEGPGSALAGRETETAMMSNVDVVPTLLDLLGSPIPDRIEGVSFRDYLAGETDDRPRTVAFTHYEGSASRGVVTREHNLIRNFGPGRKVEYPVETDPTSRSPHLGPSADPIPFVELYDRADDPHELTDVSDRHPRVVDELSDRLLTWMADVGDPLLRGAVPTPYYERAITDFLGRGAEST